MDGTASITDKQTARVALLFCQNCLGYSEASIYDDHTIRGNGLQLPFTDTNTVKAVVDEWCQAHGLVMNVSKRKQQWTVTINQPNDRTFTASPFDVSPILHRACLRAALQAFNTYVSRSR